jgi:ADP-ribose pyrophosphatase YjhB (NUDIX family)
MITHKQSAVIPYRINSGKPEILLITSMKKKNWIIPKGFVEPGMTAQESAKKEAYEEAGIKGIVQSKALGIYNQKKWGGDCRIEVYEMLVDKALKSWPEKDLRKRKWFSIKEVINRIKNKDLKDIIIIFQEKFQET